MADALDPFRIPFLTSVRRRSAAVALIAWSVRRFGITAPGLHKRVSRIAAKAARDPIPSVIVRSLWRMEALNVSAARRPRDPAPLLTHPPPLPAQPIAHVGWATGLAQRIGFEPDALRRELSQTTHDAFRLFCWDGVGADLLVHARPSIYLPARVLGVVGGGAEHPDRTSGFARLREMLTAEENRLVAHGLGRMIAVTQRTLASALVETGRLADEWRTPAIQGIGFAFAMMNYADLPAILERSRDLAPPYGPAFRDGLVYALVFDEWLGRGMLAAWQATGAFEREMLARARHEIALTGERGHPLPFAVAVPEG